MEKSANEVVTAKAGNSPGVPHNVLGDSFSRMPQAARAFAIRAVTTRGGFRPISRGPRWTDQAIHRWRISSASPYLRWHAFQTKPPRKILVTSGKLAGAARLQPLRVRQRETLRAATAPDPHNRHAIDCAP
jgi:hypothetical protein